MMVSAQFNGLEFVLCQGLVRVQTSSINPELAMKDLGFVSDNAHAS